MQRVTTVPSGNDGCHTPKKDGFTIAQILTKWEQQGIGTNAALLAGHANVREQVLPGSNHKFSRHQGHAPRFAAYCRRKETQVSHQS